MVIQNVSSDGKTTDLTFTIKRDDLDKTLSILKNNKKLKLKKLITIQMFLKFQL